MDGKQSTAELTAESLKGSVSSRTFVMFHADIGHFFKSTHSKDGS